MKRQIGFTLLEVLLVVLLMGLTAATVTLSMGSSGPKQKLERDARQFMSTTEMVLDEVVLSGQFVGIVITEHSYEYVVRKDGKWLPLKNDRLLAKRELEPEIDLSLVLEGLPLDQDEEDDDVSWFDKPFEEADVGFDKDKPQVEPQIFLFPSGEMSAFELNLMTRNDDGKDIEVSVVGHALGNMTLGRQSENATQ